MTNLTPNIIDLGLDGLAATTWTDGRHQVIPISVARFFHRASPNYPTGMHRNV